MTRMGKVGWLLATAVSLGLSPPVALASDNTEAPLPDAPSALITRHFHGLAPANGLPSSPRPSPLPASDNSHGAILLRGLKRGIRDQREIYAAPFQRSAIPWDIGFVTLSGGLIAADRHASGALSRDHLEASRRISDVGYYGTIAGAGALWLTSAATKDPHAREAGTLGLEALANTAVVYSIMQVSSGRQRPLEGDEKGHFWQNNSLRSSFPSGHAAFTWTTATVIAHEYPRPWVEWLAYGTATTVSVTRFTGLKHFPADVVVGGAFGYLIGRHIFHAHCKAGLSPACEGKSSFVSITNKRRIIAADVGRIGRVLW